MSDNTTTNGKPQSAEQRAFIAQVEEFRQARGWGDAELARKLSASETTWLRLRDGTYQGNVGKQVALLRKDMARLRADLGGAGGAIHATADLELIAEEAADLLAAARAGSENKLAWYLAPSGGGKSTAARELARRFGGLVITARQSWKESYFSACETIARALGVSGRLNGAKDAESAIIETLAADGEPRLLLLNEVEFFGTATLNLIKSLLNETPAALVIFALPEFYHQITKLGGIHAHQLQRRTRAVIVAERVTVQDAARFLAAAVPAVTLGAKDKPGDENARRCCEIMAEAANRFGRFDLLGRVAASLAADGADAPPNPADAERHCNLYLANFNLALK